MAKQDLAFPLVSSDVDSVHDTGMTLRDWFAGQALANGYTEYSEPKDIAEEAYRVADAMMEAREK